MAENKKHCQHCGAALPDAKNKTCPTCNKKLSKPIFKKWWFWVIIGVLVIGIAGAGAAGTDETPTTNNTSNNSSNNSTSNTSTTTYAKVDLQTMFDELEANALKAEKTYDKKYVEVTGKISNIDSDGSYISIEPVNASEWNFETMICYLKKDTHRDFILGKSTGDIVTIKGKIISVGEVLGYSLNIDEIQ